ncbi:MAG: arginine--tRNA ligase [Lachnospiraceae bacterium]|nr:arginine--tRNA ligase [Lachnospiraceae bacterium]
MEKIIDLIEKKIAEAFEKSGYDKSFAKVNLSDRPDLSEFQCNGAMTLAKQEKKAPYIIAEEIVKNVDMSMFEKVEVIKPGFININISKLFLSNYCNQMQNENKFGFEANKSNEIVIDYGGPNVAKPLHVGHLRSAVIGESIKRIHRFAGDKVIGDIHLGDWGLQMGLIIEELKSRNPNLPYFNENYNGEYPKEAPFSIQELAEIYPTASGKTKVKEDASEEEKLKAEEFKEKARIATEILQKGNKGYHELWKKIMEVSLQDLKNNYARLNVDFDLWLGESDSQKYIPEMIKKMEADNLIYESDGAMVVDVAEETDNIKINPCMILKTGGASCYQTTDLATLLQRQRDYNPDEVIYVVDKRQEMHFIQVFRCAKKAKLVSDKTKLKFIGFGTINGKDGKPFKTRTGGVMQLSALIDEVTKKVYDKLVENRQMSETELKEISEAVGLAALKYADLSNQTAKDYIFDMEKFTSFEGNTGPYILYTIVRIKSILNKYLENYSSIEKCEILEPETDTEKKLMLLISEFNKTVEQSYEENAPYKICSYIYELSNIFNVFYGQTKILKAEETKLKSYISLINLVKQILEICIELLGFSAPNKM